MVGGAWRIAEDSEHARSIRVPVGGSAADPAKVNQQDTDIGIGCSTQDSYNSNDTNKKGRRVNAEMDEVRLGAFVPSADWIAADYATQSSPSFLTASAAQPYEASAEPQVGVSVAAPTAALRLGGTRGNDARYRRIIIAGMMVSSVRTRSVPVPEKRSSRTFSAPDSEEP